MKKAPKRNRAPKRYLNREYMIRWAVRLQAHAKLLTVAWTEADYREALKQIGVANFKLASIPDDLVTTTFTDLAKREARILRRAGAKGDRE